MRKTNRTGESVSQMRRAKQFLDGGVHLAARGKKIKNLWDEWRVTKQVTNGEWWLMTEPDPPLWFSKGELGRHSTVGADSLFW